MSITKPEPTTAVLDDIAGDYTIDPSRSRVGFGVRRAMITTTRGAFTEFSGTAHIDTAEPANSKVELAIVADSIDTGQEERDDDLRSVGFLESERFPEIAFTSTDVTRRGSDWTVTGDLTIRGVTRSVAVPFELTGSARDAMGSTRVGFVGGTTIRRSDWGLTFNAAIETRGVVISDKVQLEFDVSAVKSA